MRKTTTALTTWVLVLFASSLVAAQASSPRPGMPDHSTFDKILRANVRGEKIDYDNIRRQHQDQLGGYLEQLAGTDVKALRRREQLAFYINLYNATVIHGVAERIKQEYSVADDDFALFKEPLVRLKDGSISLNDLEHKVIRPMFKDPRVHVALVCGARSCPPLIPRAYDARDLDAVLENNMRRFINDPKRNRFDTTGKTLLLSKIFDWYADDFGGTAGVRKFVLDYAPEGIKAKLGDGKFKPAHLRYDWSLNRKE